MLSETRHQDGAQDETHHSRSPVPTQIGEYQLVRRIGGGGMGVVYEALHTRLKKRVAIKILAEAHAGSSRAGQRFFREMEVIGRLEHPHVVRATDAGEFQGVPYLVMEYVDGADLSRIVQQYGPLPPLAALDIVRQAAEALGHIHALGFVHRDIKPSNLLLDRRGIVKVADLGVAQFASHADDAAELTSFGDIIGTIDYMSPEQADDSKCVDHRTDIYSLGCCLYFLLTGRAVFGGSSKLERLSAHRAQPIPELRLSRGLSLPASVGELFRHMIEKDAGKRPQSSAELLVEIDECREALRTQSGSGSQIENWQVNGLSVPLDGGLEPTTRILFAGGAFAAAAPEVTITEPRRIHGRGAGRWAYRIAAFVVVALVGSAAFQWWKAAIDVTGGTTVTDGDSTASPSRFIGHEGAVFTTRFSPDGHRVLSTSSDRTARVWDVNKGRVLHTLQGFRDLVINAVWAPQGDLAALACYDGRLSVCDSRSGELKSDFRLHSGRAECVVWVKDRLMLSSGVDDALLLWDLDTGNVVTRMYNSHQGGIRALAIDPSRRYALAGDYAGKISHWDLEKGEFLGWLSPVNEPISVWSIDWRSDPDVIAIGGAYADGKPLLVLFSVRTRTVVATFEGHHRRVNAVRISHDGRRLYSAADNLRVWSISPPGQLHQFDGHRGEVFGLDESPDGTTLVSGGADGTIHLTAVPGE